MSLQLLGNTNTVRRLKMTGGCVQSLMFDPYEDMTAFITTIALVLMPLSYAAQARVSQQRKADTYAANINEILLMRQRNSNSGVGSCLGSTACSVGHASCMCHPDACHSLSTKLTLEQ